MVDKVRPLKMENPADGGTELDLIPHEMNPSIDYSVVRGVVINDNDNIIIDSDGSNNLQFEDPVTGVKTLAELAGGSATSLNDLTDVTLTSVAEGEVLTYDLDTTQWINRTKRVVTSVSTTYNADEEEVILCNSTGGAFSVNLPAAASNTNKYYMIKKTDTSSNSVTVDGNGSETIDNELTQSLKKYDAIEIICDGTEWHII